VADPTTTTAAATTSEATTTTTAATTTSTTGAATTTTTETTTTTTEADPGSACDHAYFPIREGTRWSFEAADGTTGTWEVTFVSPDGAAATMEADLASPEGIVEATVNFECGDEGISAPELAFTGLPVGATITQVEEEGVFLLPADEMVPGATWTSVVTISAELLEPQDAALDLVRESVYTVEGPEEITVPAGTFTALKIRSDYTIDVGTAGTSFQTSAVEYLWFAEGVGFVRSSTEFEGTTGVSELTDYLVP